MPGTAVDDPDRPGGQVVHPDLLNARNITWGYFEGGFKPTEIKPDGTAVCGASHNIGVANMWKIPAEDAARNSEWVRKVWAQMEPLTRGQYVNIAATDDRDARLHAAYGDNFSRLAALKKRYDPNNLFRMNANIKPA